MDRSLEDRNNIDSMALSKLEVVSLSKEQFVATTVLFNGIYFIVGKPCTPWVSACFSGIEEDEEGVPRIFP